MAKKNNLGLILGIGAIGAGLFFAFRGGGKQDITVNYGSAQDQEAAEIVKKALKPQRFVFGNVNVDTITKPLVMVGGPSVNPSLAVLVSRGLFPELTEADIGKGYIFVRSHLGVKVYGIYGYEAAETLKAAQKLAELGGLPSGDVVVQ